MAFSDVSFGYTPGRQVLRHVTFEAPAGTITALAGPNGAGKTTIAQLILGFHRPQEGRVLVDELDLSRLRIRDYRAHVGFVPQDTILFQGTIADNIRYGRPSASSAEVREAARLAHCDEFVRGLPQGYATFVGERGCRLSGGERRRVAIARALLVDPRILVLDEATVYLDPESERMIEASLRTLCHGRTTFIIAHRFSAIQEADQILVLQSGAIIERGTHEELLSHRGRYRRLYETHQSRSEKEQVA
jgi:subfamily B ATP-binding cassette protein MsbA